MRRWPPKTGNLDLSTLDSKRKKIFLLSVQKKNVYILDLDHCSHLDQMVILQAISMDKEYEICLLTKPDLDAHFWI